MSEVPARSRPEPPFYAVIFTSQKTGHDTLGYANAAERMVELAQTMPGFLGFDTASGADGLGITVSYWRSEDDVARWRAHPEHAAAIVSGRSAWYSWYESVTAKVERVVNHHLPKGL
ncbi:MAG: antibiotic biosynthesis monooxygenase [Pseudomonadota bacterium]